MYDFLGGIDQTGQAGKIWGNVARQNALADAGAQFAGGDPSGAVNALLSRGWFQDANTIQTQADAAKLRAAYDTAAANVPQGTNPGVAAMIGAGQPGQAANLQNTYQGAANNAEDRGSARVELARTRETQVLGDLGNALRYADTPELYGQIWDAFAKTHPDYADKIAPYHDFETGRPLLMGRLGITPAAAEGFDNLKGAGAANARIIAQGFLAAHPEFRGREKEVLAASLEAAQNADALAVGPDGSIRLANKPGSRMATRAAAMDPEGIAERSYARATATPNAQLQAGKNRIVSLEGQIDNMEKMAGPEASGERQSFERSIGWLNAHSGKEFYESQEPWGDPNVPGIMFNLKAATHALQDELAQYMQTKGGGSDLRAKNAYDTVGALWESPDAHTFFERLKGLRKLMGTLKDVPALNPTQFPWKGQAAPAAAAPQASPSVAPLAQPAAGEWEKTATGPGGHKIGQRGGVWFDIQTGQRIQ